jgi:hypothetical protein
LQPCVIESRGIRASSLPWTFAVVPVTSSRKPKQRPDGYKLKLAGHSRTWTQKVSLSEHPGVIKFVMFAEPPGRIAGRPVDHPIWSIRLVEAKIFPDWERRLAALGAHTAEDKVNLKATDIASFRVGGPSFDEPLSALREGAITDTVALDGGLDPEHSVLGDKILERLEQIFD